MIPKEIIELQKELDQEIQKAHKLNGRDVSKEKVVALIVEFAEFSNEISEFKYWKKNKNLNQENIYEEYVDVLHFIFSLYVSLDVNADYINKIQAMEYNDILEAFIGFSYFSSQIWKKSLQKEALDKTYSVLLFIEKYYKLDKGRIIESYKRKNLKNHTRIKNNY